MNDSIIQLKMFGKKTMLYCPKCRRTYQEGTQRFCTNDGGRLLPSPSNEKSAAETSQGVFSNLLNKSAAKYESDEQLGLKPKFARNEPPVFASPRVQKILGNKPVADIVEIKPSTTDDLLELAPKATNGIPAAAIPGERPTGRLIKPHEIPSSQAELGDRKKNPTGRLAMSWANPNVLLGQTVKGRYYVEEKLSQDDSSVSFVATDKILLGKKVVVKILMDETDQSDFQSKQAADERVSLSHINHPNIAGLFDSGELLEGKPFLITEYVNGKSLRALMQQSGAVNPQRVGRIIKQIGLSLSDAHQSGVLHRGLRPEKIILDISDNGIEQVKVTDFCGFVNSNIRNQTLDKISYWSPEQIEGKTPTFSSDTYTLAIIAYEMLTGKLPFSFSSSKELLDAQKRGLIDLPSNLKSDLSPEIDLIIRKGLNYSPDERYPRARDFSESLANAITDFSQVRTHPLDEVFVQEEKSETLSAQIPPVPAPEEKTVKPEEQFIKIGAKSEKLNFDESKYLHISPKAETFENNQIKAFEKEAEIAAVTGNEGDLWKKRSPEPPKVVNLKWLFLIGIIGTLILLAGAIGVWRYYLNKQAQKAATQSEVSTVLPTTEQPQADTQPTPNTPENDLDFPPASRTITPPAGFQFYQNTKENMKDAMLKNFRGFSLYYPPNWSKIEKQGTNFVDVRRNAPNGIAIEEMIVGWYASKGTFKEDSTDFPKLSEIAGRELDKELTNYRRLDEGKKFINKDRKVYEMRFEGMRKSPSGEPYTIWGRILWIPAQRRGVKPGIRVTMITTSYSDKVKSVDDVGVNGELQKVLETFEPDSLDSGM
jgi:serine/threonine protein kinase